MKRSVRRLPALILAAGVMIGLAACTPPATNLAGCVAPFQPGDNSNAVTATGKVGSEPRVEFPTPLVADDGQVTVRENARGEEERQRYMASQTGPLSLANRLATLRWRLGNAGHYVIRRLRTGQWRGRPTIRRTSVR